MWSYPLGDVKTPQDKIREVAEKAENAFWAVVAQEFPEIRTGDYPPDTTITMREDTVNFIGWWLYYNQEQ